jgi:2-polyprenyl-3-methyl-5-hydroxy-6-metoxy-1,4-benzoquinol methylase
MRFAWYESISRLTRSRADWDDFHNDLMEATVNEAISAINLTESTDADRWIGVFQQRGVWHLTPDMINRWVARNNAFFAMLTRRVARGSKILELGCGPGRHALGAASLGYKVLGIDLDPDIVAQARANAREAGAGHDIAFEVGDMFNLEAITLKGTFQAITHGGVMEHLASARSIRDSLRDQLDLAPCVIFDVPFNSAKNLGLFSRDDIFRQLWTAEEWINDVLAGLPVVETAIELHPEANMTDDLVVALHA